MIWPDFTNDPSKPSARTLLGIIAGRVVKAGTAGTWLLVLELIEQLLTTEKPLTSAQLIPAPPTVPPTVAGISEAYDRIVKLDAEMRTPGLLPGDAITALHDALSWLD